MAGTVNESNTLLFNLRKDIQDYVHQWRRNGTGNATTAELIVMACVLSDEPLSVPEVSGWVNRHSNEVLHWMPNVWLQSVRPVYKDWRVPVHKVQGRGTKYWESPTTSANVFLRRRLFRQTPQTHFRIMDLPPEIRVSIFEFALLLPRSGVWHDFQTKTDVPLGQSVHCTKVWTAERDGALAHANYSPQLWKTDKDSPWDDPKSLFQVDLKVHLSLFRVSKSVYKESLPCYYSSNTFFLPNDWAALKFFERFSDTQLGYIGDIVWRCSNSGLPSKKLVQKLAALPRLRVLAIDMPGWQRDLWEMDMYLPSATFPLSDVLQVTAIKGLHDVRFFGPIAEHADFLRSQMVGQKDGSDHADGKGKSTAGDWPLTYRSRSLPLSLSRIYTKNSVCDHKTIRETISYDVYTAEYHGSPNHIFIFVATISRHNGIKFHVTGNILQGMTYEKKLSENPKESFEFVPGSMIRIGSIQSADLDLFEAACEAVEVPGAQLKLNGERKDPSKPVRRCGEWVQDAKEKVIADGILQVAEETT